jgi:predicted small integral membrane protein
MIINPIITPPVTDDRAFATRAILGEEQWLADPVKRRDIIVLNAVSTACLAVAGVTAWRRRPLPMAIALAGSMTAILMTSRSYADHYDPDSSNLGSA